MSYTVLKDQSSIGSGERKKDADHITPRMRIWPMNPQKNANNRRVLAILLTAVFVISKAEVS